MASVGLKSGTLLRHGAYRIERILGQGGFGITYLATDLSLDRLVAIKEFFPKDYCDRDGETTSQVTLGTSQTGDLVEKLQGKFLKEARNIAKLDHPGIIKIHAAFEENNTAYYVMDYVEGLSVSALVKDVGPLNEPDAIKYITEAGDALDYVHKHKINHLDVKPSNIMIRSRDNRAILIDFGLSKQYDADGVQTSTTPTGISHGFAPLEQYNQGGVGEFSPATDVYSLGATLYYMLTGNTPPPAPTVVQDGLPFPENFPSDLRPVITKAMSPTRRSRHSGVRQFLDAIKNNDDTVIIPDVISDDTWRSEKKDSGKVVPEEKKEEAERPKPEVKKRRNMLPLYSLIIVALLLLIGVGAFVWIGRGGSVADTGDNNSNDDAELIVVVQQFPIATPLGAATYTGEANEVNDSIRPHGRGIAKWSNGEALEYDGEWLDGEMDGEATYVLRNGDKFEGTFRAGKYEKGKYTVYETGEYFEGSFKDGQPEQGHWYSKNGKVLD